MQWHWRSRYVSAAIARGTGYSLDKYVYDTGGPLCVAYWEVK
jgi:hypothetical protein